MRDASLAYLFLFALAAAACGGAPKAPSTPPAEKTIFSDAPAFAPAPVASSAAAAHAAKKIAAPSKATPCLGCHKDGGSAPAFSFAGSIYADKEATKGAADVEIRVEDNGAPAVSVHSDADGNFWSKGPALKGPAHAGARSAIKTRIMNQPTTTGDCNSCHAADMPALLTVP